MPYRSILTYLVSLARLRKNFSQTNVTRLRPVKIAKETINKIKMSKTFIVFLSQCSVTCGSGKQTRPVKCTSEQGVAVAHTKCDPEKKPLTKKPCDLKTPCPYWFAGKWTDVSITFGISGILCPIYCRGFKRTSLQCRRTLASERI